MTFRGANTQDIQIRGGKKMSVFASLAAIKKEWFLPAPIFSGRAKSPWLQEIWAKKVRPNWWQFSRTLFGGSGGIRTHEPLRTTAFRVFFIEVKNWCFRANSGFLVCAENRVASGFWQFCPRLLAWIKWVQSKMRNFQKNANFWKNARKKARKQPFLGLKIPKYCKMARHHARHF